MSCDTRWWVLRHGLACGPVVVKTTDVYPDIDHRLVGMEIIDRQIDPLPPYEPEVVA
jgi:predicted ThiF/HesA family dinucleotide-utilizing enzyme